MFSFLRITQENPKQKRVFFTVVFSDLLNSFVRTFLNYSDLKDIDDDFNTQTDNFMKILGELKKTSGATIRLKDSTHKQNIKFERGGVSHFIVKNGEGPDEKGFLSDFLSRFGEADDIFIFPAYATNRNETFNTVIFSNQSNLDSQTSLVEVIYDQGQACCPPAE